LVLNIEVPDVPGADLGRAVRDLSDDFVAYGIGFAVVGLFWYEHHRLFSRLSRGNPRLVVVNMMMLAAIALMPFTTALLGRYDEPLAVALYAGNVAVAIVLNGLVALVALDGGLRTDIHDAADAARRRRATIAGALARAGVFLASIAIAYGISEGLAQWFWLTLILVSVAERRASDEP
jgi:uncharacterized membrane protein